MLREAMLEDFVSTLSVALRRVDDAYRADTAAAVRKVLPWAMGIAATLREWERIFTIKDLFRPSRLPADLNTPFVVACLVCADSLVDLDEADLDRIASSPAAADEIAISAMIRAESWLSDD